MGDLEGRYKENIEYQIPPGREISNVEGEIEVR
jgi:hypothetical protein